MAQFLTTNGTSYHIENIIIGAKKELVLLSPYLQLSKTFFERLKDASLNGVKITVIYGKDELKPNEKNSLAELKNISLFFFENLHAKCYFNESEMVITSMNMYEFSEKNNREMGVHLSREADKDLYEKARAEAQSVKQSSEEIELVKKNRAFNSRNKNILSKRGYCIRCEDRIPFDPRRPLCDECYSIWAQYKNPQYIEEVCHSCGEYDETSMEKPLCYDCFLSSVGAR